MPEVTLPAVPALCRTTSKLIAAIGGRLQRRSAGQGMVEYALVLMLVALVIIVIMTVLGTHVSHLYSNIANGIPG
jgi:pilus assembly protein Flp/PilA